MKEFKYPSIGMMLLAALLLLTACSTGQEETELNKKEAQADASRSTTPADEVPKAPRTAEDMISQKPGWLMKKHFDEEIEAVQPIDWFQYRNFYEKTFQPIMEKEIGDYFKKNEKQTSDEVYDYLVYTLGSGQYKKFYEPLDSFESGFQAPDLPEGKESTERKQKQQNVVMLMDASGSMKAKVPGGVKMDLAKAAIEEFAAGLPKGTAVSLLVYGHVGSGSETDQAKSCRAIEAVFPLAPYEKGAFKAATGSFQASGWTPLAAAINQAADILSAYPSDQYTNSVYIVSDGIETCGGDPVAAAKKLQAQNIQAQVNIIGFDVDDSGQKQLKEVAEAGGGDYATVKNKEELQMQVTKKWRPSLFEIVGKQGVPLHEYVSKTSELSDYKGRLTDLSDREKNRITNALSFLSSKKLIDDQTKEEVQTLAEEMNQVRNSHFQRVYEAKSQQLEEHKKEIDSKVEDWKEKWQE
ncbi:vWA domain-containing protein [Pseudobacillus badius]|uniref:vWA domain-containing protein n=1 Tax=Bacillus badius TaxID=1455 RepID=UPI003CEFB6F1